MPAIIYTTKANDMLDMIIFKYYGEAAVSEGTAVEYILKYNQNFSRNEIILPAGLKLTLPELPENVTSKTVSEQVEIFN